MLDHMLLLIKNDIPEIEDVELFPRSTNEDIHDEINIDEIETN